MLASVEPHVFPFDNSYARLPARFFARLPPTPVAAPRLVRLNETLARQLGLDPARLSSPNVYSSIDGFGRYAYGNQPPIAQWNFARLAETLLPFLAEDQEAAVEMANDALGKFAGRFQPAYAAGLRRKLGLFRERQDDGALAQDLIDRMAGNGADFTLTFRRLSDAAISTDGDAAVRSQFTDPTAYDAWAASWRQRLATTAR